MIDTTMTDIHTVVADLDTRVSLLETRLEVIPSTSPVPPLLAIRQSLTALENSAKLCLTNHAASLMDSLARRRARGPSRGDGGRMSGASGWSVASDSQLLVDAPADHGGNSPPMQLRGGGLGTIPTHRLTPRSRVAFPAESVNLPIAETPWAAHPHVVAQPDPLDGVDGEPLQRGEISGCPQESRGRAFTPEQSQAMPIPVGAILPTPWSRGNEFSARANAANALRLSSNAQPSPVGFSGGGRDCSAGFTGDAPAEVFIQGHWYSQVSPKDDTTSSFVPAMESNQEQRYSHGLSRNSHPPGFPPAVELGQSTLLPSARKVSTLGKFWHGGGNAASFMTGVECLSPSQVVVLGVPEIMAFVVVSTHNQIVSQWSRCNDRNGMRDRNGYGDGGRSSEGQGRLFGPNHHEAIKHIGWPELPREGVSPERWIEFYTDLQLMGNYFNIGIMPFEALDLRYSDGGHALCICGLGYSIFTKMGTSLFLNVQRLLPLTVPEISTKVQLVALNGGNRFELLWILTKHFVPMVSTTKNLGWPTWPSSDDVFLFARRVTLFCTLSRL